MSVWNTIYLNCRRKVSRMKDYHTYVRNLNAWKPEKIHSWMGLLIIDPECSISKSLWNKLHTFSTLPKIDLKNADQALTSKASRPFWKTFPRFLYINNLLNLLFWIILQEKMGRKYCWWLSLLSLAQRHVYCWICELSYAIQWTFLHLCQLSKSWVKKRWNCKHYKTGDRRENPQISK